MLTQLSSYKPTKLNDRVHAGGLILHITTTRAPASLVTGTSTAMPQSTPQREPLPLLSTPSLDPKSHGAVQGAIEMVLIHNCFIRAMNSIYYHAPYVTEPKDIRDYLHFCATFVAVLFHHHDCEERFIFPPWAEATNCPDFSKYISMLGALRASSPLWVSTSLSSNSEGQPRRTQTVP